MANKTPYITLELLKDGPILVKGAVSFIREEGGEAYEDGAPPIALCRCGCSENKPFCDGSHKNCDSLEFGSPPGLPSGEIE